jgi:hypothetical protein
MSQQIVCDNCKQPIDQSVGYYTAQVSPVQMVDGVLTSGGTEQHDYHAEHLPVLVGQMPADEGG